CFRTRVVRNPLTVFVTISMTSFVMHRLHDSRVSSNSKTYGYPRGAEPLAQALPSGQRSFKGYAMVGGTGALPIVARLREATDEAKQKLRGMRQRGLRHPLRYFGAPLFHDHLKSLLRDQARRSAKSRSAASTPSTFLDS